MVQSSATVQPATLLPSLPRWALPLVLLLFFCSGLSGLIYEVIWTRVLLTVFGATIYAVATVLAAFMAGLALGSFAGGRVADRLARPLAWYGIVEVVVAATALAVPAVLDAFDPLYRMLYAAGEASFFQLSLIRFAISFAVLLVPTTCMGATLPLLSRFLVRRSDALGGRVGALYAVNTSGAVAGTFLAGFVLIAALGVWGSMVAAAVVSVVVGVLALVASRYLESGTEPVGEVGVDETANTADDGPRLPPWFVWLVLATYGCSGFAALALQVFWTRALVFRFDILKNTTYSFSAMLTVFLVGLAAGSAVMSTLINRQRDPVRLYGLLLLLTGIAAALSLYLLLAVSGTIELPGTFDAEGRFRWIVAVGNVFLRTGATLLMPTFLMGMAFPVAARLSIRHLQAVGSGTGRLYAINTIGAIAGSFCAGFLLIPWFGLARGILVLGALYVAAGAVVLVANPVERRAARLGWAVAVIVVVGALLTGMVGGTPFQEIPPGSVLVTGEGGRPAYVEGPLATVAVQENSIGDRTITIDNVAVAGTDRILLTDQKSLAHVPMLLLSKPRSALTVGFGSGGASWSLLRYQELEQVDCIEISPTVPRLAHTLRASNHGLLDGWDRRSDLAKQRFFDGRYRVIIDDARSYLRFAGRRYDMIATDCTDLRYKSNANLYDLEYFELCRSAITEHGMVVVWMPLGGMSNEVFACAMRTFAQVFPDMTIWYMNNEPTHYLLLLGTRQPLRINLSRLLGRISRPEVRQDLAEVSLHQAEKMLSCFLTDAPAVEAKLRAINDALNTEDRPYLEFESPKYGLADEPLLANLELLRSERRSVLPYIEDAAAHPEVVRRLERYAAALDPILEGHAHYRRLQLVEAARCYQEAQRICPEDESVAFLLGFDELRRRSERFPGDLWSALMLARVALVRGDLEEARSSLVRLLRSSAARSDEVARSVHQKALLGLAECALEMDAPRQGLRLLARNRHRFEPSDAALQELVQRLEQAAAAETIATESSAVADR